ATRRASESGSFFHLIQKQAEQVVRVMRTRRGLGMILHTEHGLRDVPEAFDRAVVQVYMGYLHVVRYGPGVDGQSMVLRRDLDLAGLQLFDRMICPAMSELELEGASTHRQAKNLMSQADAEHGHVAVDQISRVGDRVVERGRVARTVAQEDAV